MASDYNIGYGRPPRRHRFKKGQSGNPKGRPKRTIASEAKLIRKIFNQAVYVKEGSKRIRIPLHNQIERVLLAECFRGNSKARRMFERYRDFSRNFGISSPILEITVRRF